MKRNTLILLVIFLAMLGVVLYAGSHKPPEAPERLRLEGWKVLDPLKVADAPYDRIEILRGGAEGSKVVIERSDDEGDHPSWRIVQPLEVGAELYRINAIVGLFSKGLEAVASRPLGAKARKLYGLEGEGALRVRLSAGEGRMKTLREKVDKLLKKQAAEKGGGPISGDPIAKVPSEITLIIGRQDKVADPSGGLPVVRTWIQVEGQEVVHAVEGRDLRKALDLSADELRSKRVLDLGKWSDIDRFERDNPGATGPKRIVIERVAAAGAGGKKPETWRFVSPAGLDLGSPRLLFSSYVNLNATRILAASKVSEDTGLDGPKAATVKLMAGEREVVLTLGPERGDHYWVKLSTRPEERYKCSKYSRAQLLKEASDLRNKKVLGIGKKESITHLEIRRPGARPLRLIREGLVWVRGGDAAKADLDALNLLLNALVNFRASRFATAEEAAKVHIGPSALRLRITLGNETKDLWVGPEHDSNAYARVGRSGEIFLISKYQRSQLDKSWDALRNKRVFGMSAGEAERLSLLRPGEPPIILELRPGAAPGADARGSTEKLWTLVSPARAGKTVKQGAVRSILTTLAALKAKTLDPKVDARGAGLDSGHVTLSVEARLRDGRTLRIDFGDKKEGDDPYARAIGGTFRAGKIFSVASYQARTFDKKLKDLLR